jgi:hypothetical protein
MRAQFLPLVVTGLLLGNDTFSPPDAAAQRPGGAFPLHVEAVHAVGLDDELGSVIAAALAPNGRVYALDHINAQLVAYSPEGRLLWKRGRKGGGPGEFSLPYRLAVRSDGGILVYDLITGSFTAFTPDGEFIERTRLPFRVRLFDDFAVLPTGDLVIAGILDPTRDGAGNGLHLFREAEGEWTYVGSVGPVPLTEDPVVREQWGAGTVALAVDGSILYGPRLPYEIHRFTPDLRPRGIIRPPFRLPGRPDDVIRVERSGSSTTISRSESRIEFPATFTEIFSGWLLAGRTSQGGPKYWDLFTPSGEHSGTRALPAEWGGITGYDAARGLLWLTGTADDVPVLLRLRISRGR